MFSTLQTVQHFNVYKHVYVVIAMCNVHYSYSTVYNRKRPPFQVVKAAHQEKKFIYVIVNISKCVAGFFFKFTPRLSDS